MNLESIFTILSSFAGVVALLWNIYDYIREKTPKLEMICPYSALIIDEGNTANNKKTVLCVQAKIANFRKAPVVPYWHTINIRVLTADGWQDNFKITWHITPPKITNHHAQIVGYVGMGHIPYFSMHDMTPITNETPYVRLFPITVDSILNLHNIREIEFQFNDSLKRSITLRSEIRIINLPAEPE